MSAALGTFTPEQESKRLGSIPAQAEGNLEVMSGSGEVSAEGEALDFSGCHRVVLEKSSQAEPRSSRL